MPYSICIYNNRIVEFMNYLKSFQDRLSMTEEVISNSKIQINIGNIMFVLKIINVHTHEV